MMASIVVQVHTSLESDVKCGLETPFPKIMIISKMWKSLSEMITQQPVMRIDIFDYGLIFNVKLTARRLYIVIFT